jgi:hypothetical protein
MERAIVLYKERIAWHTPFKKFWDRQSKKMWLLKKHVSPRMLREIQVKKLDGFVL